MQQTNNYFRANHPAGAKFYDVYVFFDDRDEQRTRAAFAAAEDAKRAMSGHVSVFRPPLHAGPWDDAAQLVGHRTRAAMEESLQQAINEDEQKGTRDEMAALEHAIVARRIPRIGPR